MIKFNADGWIEGENTRRLPSPFFDEREGDAPTDLIVMHNISLPAGAFGTGFVEKLFLGELLQTDIPGFESLRDSKVSSHFFIDRQGAITQFVSTLKRAWHAGVSEFKGKTRCNDFSIGIEMEGSDFVAFEPRQYESLKKLLVALTQSCPQVSFITGHSDIAPGRKTDPGPFFDWAFLLSAPELINKLQYTPIQPADNKNDG